VLVSGGARSGKSAYALARAAVLPAPRVFVATATAGDGEMAARIAAHRRERGAAFTTIEEALAPAGVLAGLEGATGVAVVDCVTLWIANLLARHDDPAVAAAITTLADTIARRGFPVVVVTNEVGWGIVPFDAETRRFRDLLGLANQRLASAADEVVLMVAGIPVAVKGPR
jgi:adenosylcobinamide kinase/adenosylcobinamide-phosphate guanylyltransferase